MSNGAVLPAVLPELCTWCPMEDMGTKELKHCIKCTRPFCPEHASAITPNCCKECFADFAYVIKEHTKTDVEYDEKTDSLITHRSSGQRINLMGPDYVWYSIWIQHLTDEELATSFQFHRFVISLLETTKDVRQVQRNQKLAGEKFTSRITTSTTTEIKKTRKVKQQKSLRDILIASGIKEGPQLEAMLAAAGVQP